MTIITPTGITGINSITSSGSTLVFQSASGTSPVVTGLDNISSSGIITATGFVGNVTGNVNSTGVSTIATLNVTQSNLTNLNVSGVTTTATLRATSIVGVTTAGITSSYTNFIGINTNASGTGGGFNAPQLYLKSLAANWTGGFHFEASDSSSVGVINHSSDGFEISQSYRTLSNGGSYKPIIFRTSGVESLKIGTDKKLIVGGNGSQYVEISSFRSTNGSTLVTNNAGTISLTPITTTNTTVISHNPSSNPERITFNQSGCVYISCYQDIITAGATGYAAITLYRNGSLYINALITNTNGQWDSIFGMFVIEVSANDYIYFYTNASDILAWDDSGWGSYNIMFYPIVT
jgi:hypothetical protein